MEIRYSSKARDFTDIKKGNIFEHEKQLFLRIKDIYVKTCIGYLCANSICLNGLKVRYVDKDVSVILIRDIDREYFNGPVKDEFRYMPAGCFYWGNGNHEIVKLRNTLTYKKSESDDDDKLFVSNAFDLRTGRLLFIENNREVIYSDIRLW